LNGLDLNHEIHDSAPFVHNWCMCMFNAKNSDKHRKMEWVIQTKWCPC